MSKMKSDLGWSTRERIVVRGKDLPGEILGHLNLGDMASLELMGRVPNPRESKLFNAMVVTLVEHGITPSALAARLTYLGAPEAMQAAVAAGLSGLGSVFVGVAVMDVPAPDYLERTRVALGYDHALSGLVKGTAFGFAVGLAGCYHGLRSGRGPSAVGRAVKNAVVTAILWVVVVDATLTAFFKWAKY